MILGVAGFDHEAAFELLRKQTFGNYTRQIPALLDRPVLRTHWTRLPFPQRDFRRTLSFVRTHMLGRSIAICDGNTGKVAVKACPGGMRTGD